MRVRPLIRWMLPDSVGHQIARWEHIYAVKRLSRRRSATWLRLGALWRSQPIRRNFGWKSGQCIDRYYIERFLDRYAVDVRGSVLEIADDTYTRRFGGNRVTSSEVLHFQPGNPYATIAGDLASSNDIPSQAFDCVILTQTLQFIYETQAAIKTLYRILKPGGILLATFPGISQIARYDMEHWGEYWRFTTLSARKLFSEAFPADRIAVESHGNVLTAMALLHGLVSAELRPDELDYHDRDYEVLITLRAVKPVTSALS